MKLTLRNRYVKGICALGLALSLSNSYLPLSAEENSRQDERVLRFEIDEVAHRKLANISGRKIKEHIKYATYQTSSKNIDRLKHVKIAKEIVQALQILMPQMQLLDRLSEMQIELAEGDYYLFHYDVHSMTQQIHELKLVMPEFAAKLKDGLQSIEQLIIKDEDQSIVTRKLSQLYSALKLKTAYLPLHYLERNLNTMENILSREVIPQKKMLTLYNETKELCNKDLGPIMIS